MRAWFHRHSILLTLLPVIMIMVMIFCFSAQNGERSGALSGTIARWLAGLLVPNFDTLPDPDQTALLRSFSFFIRKTAHFSEYALLGFFLMLHIREIQKKTALHLPVVWAWCTGALYAVTDELHQGFVGGRNPALMDVAIDSCGVFAGVLLCLFLCKLLRRKAALTV